jgi:ParB/RepB/Spo0J family partition protein
MRMQKGKVENDAGKASKKKSRVSKATVIVVPTPEPPPAPIPEPRPPTPTPTPQPPAPPPEPQPPDLPYVADKIYSIPLLKIRVAPQVRSHVTTTEAPFLALKESIRERGVLSPVILIREAADGFLLVSGERRYWACESLNMQTIPARIIEGVDDPSDRIALQLIENMIREDLDPIDEAQGYLNYLQGKRPGIAASALVNDLVTFNMDSSRLPEEVLVICRALERMAGKTAGMIRCLIALLDLPTEIREAVRYRKIGTGHGICWQRTWTIPSFCRSSGTCSKRP